MPESLLATKWYIPTPPVEWVTRPRLQLQLDLIPRTPLTLISAPAGYGKSTLTAVWIKQHAERAAWLSLDDGDNDPVRFLSYLLAVLCEIEPTVKGLDADLKTPQAAANLMPVLLSLINTLSNSQPIVLVLDDFHLVTAPQVHNLVSFLVEHNPPALHLVLLTRLDPPLPMARLRARRQLNEIRVADLRFTPDESRLLLNQQLALGLDEDQIESLTGRTEGWITGLQLAALSLRQQPDAVAFIAAFTGSHQYILDYLVEETLKFQPPEVIAFLLDTSILRRLTGDLCNAVTGRQDGAEMLIWLEKANLFTFALDQERRWFRYHHLFADLLRTRLEHRGRNLNELHQHAGEWFAKNGFISDAISHLVQGRALPTACDIVEKEGYESLFSGETLQVKSWVGLLPDEMVKQRPFLLAVLGWACLLNGDMERVKMSLEHLELQLGQMADSNYKTQLKGMAASLRAYEASLRNDIDQTQRYSRQALDWLPETEVRLRLVMTFALGIAATLNGELKQSTACMEEVGRQGRQAGNLHIAIPALCILALQQVVLGQMQRARLNLEEARQITVDGRSLPLPMAARVFSAFSQLEYEQNHLALAVENAQKAIEINQRWCNYEVAVYAPLTLAEALNAQGKPAEALEQVSIAERTSLKAHLPMSTAAIALTRARIQLAQGELNATLHWALEHKLTFEGQPNYFMYSDLLFLCRVMLESLQTGRNQYNPDNVLRILDWLEPCALKNGLVQRSIAIHALRAMTVHWQGKSQESMDLLAKALALAESEGYLRSLIDQGPLLYPLLGQLHMILGSQSTDTHWEKQAYLLPYLSRLLEACPFSKKSEEPAPGYGVLPEALSERELQLLRLVAEGRSNQEIAEQLVIAISTVKSHLNTIFSKMGVKNRTEAVARGRAQHLV